MDYAKESLRLHGEWKGKIEVVATVPVATKDDLSLAYSPLTSNLSPLTSHLTTAYIATTTYISIVFAEIRQQ